MQNKNSNNNNEKSTLDIDSNLSRGEVLHRYRANKAKHLLYGVVSFLMTAAFYVVFISPGIEQVFTDTFDLKVSAWVWAAIGLLFSIVITVLIMHSHTTDRPAGKYAAYGVVILLGLLFNVFTEVSSTSDRVQERVTVKSENSALFKSLAQALNHSSGDVKITGLEGQIAKAQQRLARCEHNLKLGREKHCEGDKANLQALKDQASEARAATASNTEVLADKAAAAANNEAHAQMTIRLVMEQFGLSFKTATMFVSLFIIGVFEVLGATIGYDYRRYRDALPYYGIELHKDKETEFDLKIFQQEVAADERRMKAEIKEMEVDLARYKSEMEHQARADKLRAELAKFKQQLQAAASPSMGSARVDFDDSPAPENPHIPAAHPAHSAPADVANLESVGGMRQNPYAMRDSAHSESAVGKASCADVLEGAKSPAHSAHSESAHSAPADVAKPGADVAKLDDEKGRMILEINAIYPMWKEAMLSGEVENKLESSKTWLRKGKKSGVIDISKVGDSYTSPVINTMYQMAVSDGWMKLNPEFRHGNSRIRKYIFV
jgi:uncharacterized membrane-anchored protein YhcB (DUF1043 family)/type II secretory pathway component PulM